MFPGLDRNCADPAQTSHYGRGGTRSSRSWSVLGVKIWHEIRSEGDKIWHVCLCPSQMLPSAFLKDKLPYLKSEFQHKYCLLALSIVLPPPLSRRPRFSNKIITLLLHWNKKKGTNLKPVFFVTPPRGSCPPVLIPAWALLRGVLGYYLSHCPATAPAASQS